MNRIHSIPHLLCLSIVAMGCPTVSGGSTLKPEASTRNDRNYRDDRDDRDDFEPKRRKISGPTDCPEQAKQNPEQANSSRKASKAVTENEESKEETTPGTCDTHALAATTANPSNAGSNTGTGSPTSSCSPSKKSPVVAQLTTSSIGLPKLIQEPLSTLPNGVRLQDIKQAQAQHAATKAQEAVNNPKELKEAAERAIEKAKKAVENPKEAKEAAEQAVQKVVQQAKQAAVSYKKLIELRCENLNSAEDLAKSHAGGIKDPQTKITEAQALVAQLEALKADDKQKKQVESFKKALNEANTALENADNQVNNVRVNVNNVQVKKLRKR